MRSQTATSSTSVDVPRTISYQGAIALPDGSLPQDGTYPVTVTLYGDENGSSVVWQGAYNVGISQGVFNILLGAGGNPLPSPTLMSRPLWVGLKFVGKEEMRPLAPLSSTAYAMNVSDNAITESKLADGAVTSSKMGTEFVSGISVNGHKVTEKGGSLNIQTGPGINATFDPASQSLLLAVNGSGSNSKGAQAQYVAVNGTSTTGTCTSNNSDGSNAHNTASGGCDNNASGVNGANDYSTVAGGLSNIARGKYAVVGGGNGNQTATSKTVTSPTYQGPTIAGGENNEAFGSDATVGGGKNNDAVAANATISGGNGNTINSGDDDGTVSGGVSNVISGSSVTDATIAGGNTNKVNGSGTYGTVSGGRSNTASGGSSTISGGNSNAASGSYSTIAGGYGNVASGDYSFVTGNSNTAGANGTVPGGQLLTVGDSSFGFNGDGSGNVTDVSVWSSVAYFGNVDLKIGNVDSSARSLQFYSPNNDYTYWGGTAYKTSIKAGIQSADINYTLPTTLGNAGDALTLNTVSSPNASLTWSPKLNGSGTATQVAWWSGSGASNTLSSNSNLYYDTADAWLGIGTSGAPAYPLDVRSSATATGISLTPHLSTSSTAIGLYISPVYTGSPTTALAIDAAGDVRISSPGSTSNQLQLASSTSPGLNTFASNDTTNQTLNYILPRTMGSANQVLSLSRVVSTTGNLAWVNQTGGGGGGDTTNQWHLTGNLGTTPGINYLGTGDNTALELHVNGAGTSNGGDGRVFRVEPHTSSPSFINGYHGNAIGGAGKNGITIAGGGHNNALQIDSADYSTIGGGASNMIYPSGEYATIPGGDSLIAQSYGQTAIGTWNQATGWRARTDIPNPALDDTASSAVLVVGNGSPLKGRSNAFAVMNSGHARDYQRIGNGPVNRPITNGIYEDNQVIAYGVIPTPATGDSIVIPRTDFGVLKAEWGGINGTSYPSNWCILTLNDLPGLDTEQSSITANISQNCSIGGYADRIHSSTTSYDTSYMKHDSVIYFKGHYIDTLNPNPNPSFPDTIILIIDSIKKITVTDTTILTITWNKQSLHGVGICTVIESGAQLAHCLPDYVSVPSLNQNQIAVITYGFEGFIGAPPLLSGAIQPFTLVPQQLPFDFKVAGRSRSIAP